MFIEPRRLDEISAHATVLGNVHSVDLRGIPRSVLRRLVSSCLQERGSRTFFLALLRCWPHDVFTLSEVDLSLQWSDFEVLLTAIENHELGATRVLDLSAMNYTSVTGVKFFKRLFSINSPGRPNLADWANMDVLVIVLNLLIQEQDYYEIEKILSAGPIFSLKARFRVEVKIAHLKVCLLFARIMHVLTLMDPNYIVGFELGYFGDQNGPLLRQVYRQLQRFGDLQTLAIGYLPKSRPLAVDLESLLPRFPKLQQLSLSAIEMYPDDCARILLSVSSKALRVLRLHWCDMSATILKALNDNKSFSSLRWLELDGVASTTDQPASVFINELVKLLDKNSSSITRLTIKDVDFSTLVWKELCETIRKLTSLQVLDIASDAREYEEFERDVFPLLGKYGALVYKPQC